MAILMPVERNPKITEQWLPEIMRDTRALRLDLLRALSSCNQSGETPFTYERPDEICCIG